MMGWFSSLCSAVGSFVSGVCSAAKSLCSALAPVALAIGKNLNMALTIISTVIEVIGFLRGVLKENEKIEDIGERALQAEEDGGITLEKCHNNFEEYQKKIREFSIDETKKHPQDQRLAAGILFVEEGLKQQYPTANLASMYPLIAMNKDYFTAERIEKYLEVAAAGKISLDKVAKYFDGTCSADDMHKAKDVIMSTEKSLNPQAQNDEIQKEVNVIRREAEAKL